ncbi:FAD-binding protein [Bradyrhizobium diazoefficiens]|nr:FAD-linked oxidase C-terminal domain-containing protein [Bradyrhizobium diazoefficiens]QQN62282.1 FAD-binding protein [Bradyrhizobium diazoefficiens]
MAVASQHNDERKYALSALAARFGEALSTAEAVRSVHGHDESYHPAGLPDAVLLAKTRYDVIEAVRLCHEHRLPIVAYGTGTGLEGSVNAVCGGLSIDLSGMNQILRVSQEDQDCTVEAGVTRKQLNSYLRDTGLFFPIDPGVDASIGGMTATRASGTNAVRYGTMRDNVIALTAVVADGRLIKTANRARKSAAGYDLTRLFVGSEGTFGIITDVTLRLHGVPEAISAAICAFPSVAAAIETVVTTIQAGIPVARVEFLDEAQVAACNRFSGLSLKETPTLFFEFHGSQASAAEQAESVRMIALDAGGADFDWAAEPDRRAMLWRARHDALYASKAMRPGALVWATDVCVPISSLAECLIRTKEDIVGSGLTAPIVGHVGDGNFHVQFILDPERPEEFALAKAVNSRMIERAIAFEGTSTGEHGVGVGKIDYMEAEHGDAIDIMWQLKRALDPQNILNPGKILPVRAGLSSSA